MLLGWPKRLRPAGRQLTLAMPLAIILLSLTALAYASPPDPSWVPGVYDGVDYDDVVVMLTELGKASPPATPLDALGDHPFVTCTTRAAALWAPPVAAALARQFRSPPGV